MGNRKANAIIQARMGSTRLPGKVLMEIEGIPILEHIVKRLKAVNGVNEIIIATSTKQDDNLVADFCKKNRIPCVRGSEENVLERFAMVAKKHPAEIYIRATGDNPMIDVKMISDMIEFFIEKDLTYTCYKNYPIGSGVEIFSDVALLETIKNADKPYELEHVTPYMYQTMQGRRVLYYESDKDNSKLRMTVDTKKDLVFARELFKRLYNDNHLFGIEDIQKLLEKEPMLKTINSDVQQKRLGE